MFRLKRLPTSLLPLILLLILPGLMSCQNEQDSLWEPTIGLPIVTGIVVRDESGNSLHTLGNPTGQGVEASPNPGGFFQIPFSLPEKNLVKAWVNRTQNSTDTSQSYDAGIGTIMVPEPAIDPVVITLMDGVMNPGDYLMQWPGRDKYGYRVPTGYYRIYVRIGAEVLHDDVFYINPHDIRFPAGLDFEQ